MLAQFAGLQHDSLFGFTAPATLKPASAVAPKPNDPLAVTRLGDLLPLVLERYGYAPVAEDRTPPERHHRETSRLETNRPDIARGRRRVG